MDLFDARVGRFLVVVFPDELDDNFTPVQVHEKHVPNVSVPDQRLLPEEQLLKKTRVFCAIEGQRVV